MHHLTDSRFDGADLGALVVLVVLFVAAVVWYLRREQEDEDLSGVEAVARARTALREGSVVAMDTNGDFYDPTYDPHWQPFVGFDPAVRAPGDKSLPVVGIALFHALSHNLSGKKIVFVSGSEDQAEDVYWAARRMIEDALHHVPSYRRPYDWALEISDGNTIDWTVVDDPTPMPAREEPNDFG